MKLKVYIPEDLSFRWSLVLGLLMIGMTLYLRYSFFCRHFTGGHPNLFFILLTCFSVVLITLFRKLKVFSPIKVTLAMMLSFTFSIVVIDLQYYSMGTYGIFSIDALPILLLSPFAGFIFMGLFISLPTITILYTAAIHLQRRWP